jgi:hypothetical protein
MSPTEVNSTHAKTVGLPTDENLHGKPVKQLQGKQKKQ